jgi:hypothetical protein
VPTDIVAAIKRRSEAKKQRKAAIAILGVCFVVCVMNVMLLFIDKSFAQALDLWAGPGSAYLACGGAAVPCPSAKAR